MSVRITSFRLTPDQRLGDGRRRLAQFDAEMTGLRLLKCAILENVGGGYQAYPPAGARGHAVWFMDDDLRAEFQTRALEMLERFTGGAGLEV